MRLFVALNLDAGTQSALADFQGRLRALDVRQQVRWVEPGSVHLTLRFLGEFPEARLQELESELGSALEGRLAPRIGLSMAGAFPNLRRARVLWVGLGESGQPRLAAMQSALEASVVRLGLEPEGRAFQPHLTLGRVREGRESRPAQLPPALLAAMAVFRATTPPAAQRRVALVRSHLSPHGARHEAIRVWELTDSDTAA